MEAQDSCENQACFSNHFVSKDFGIQTHNCLMLRKATIIGPSRPCAKSTSLAIAHIVSNTLGFVVQQCVLNQSQGYWLLLDALAVAISLVYQM
jgi:hypothetical protein